MRADIPSWSYFLSLGLTNTSVVVKIFEQQDPPEFLWSKIDKSEQIILPNTLNHEVNLRFSRIEVSLLSVDPNAVEISINNFASKLLESPQQDVEALGHELVNQSVEQWVVELGHLGRGQPSLHIWNECVCILVLIYDVFQPALNEFLELLEGCWASDKLIEVSVELCGELTLLILRVFTFVVLKGSVSSAVCVHGCFFKLLYEFTLQDRIDSKITDFNFNSVTPIESFLDNLWILYLVLEVASEVLILMSSQIWKTCVGVPKHMSVEWQVSGIEGIDNRKLTIFLKVAHWDVTVPRIVDPVLQPLLALNKLGDDCLESTWSPSYWHCCVVLGVKRVSNHREVIHHCS